MTHIKLQEELFRQIRDRLPPEANIADVISDVLHLSTDSAYRRIRGETPLVLEELASLCQHFGMSLDGLFGNSNNSVVFENIRVHYNNYSYSNYLDSIIQLFESMKNLEEKEIIYISKDLPVFHNFYFRPLNAFRYYFWMKIQFLHPDFKDKLFDFEILPPVIEEKSKKLIQNYCLIPSTEMWNIESINSTLSQIEFSRTSGHFRNREDVVKIYEAVESTIL